MDPTLLYQEGPGIAGKIRGGTSRTKITGTVGTTTVAVSSSSPNATLNFSAGSLAAKNSTVGFANGQFGPR
jgi:type 1 fimbria pilin